jgi:glycosyltransferase involved in cell wall biosynthesis
LSVVVPAFREERIGIAVMQLRDALADVETNGGVEIIVVDDGSHDGTAELAEQAGADVVLRQPVNRGKGAAVRAGMLVAGGSTVAFTDADLSYAPAQLLVLLSEVEAGWDVVVGSRRHTETTTLVRAGRLRELGGRVINLLTNVVLLGAHRDTQCGIKAFRGDAAALIFSHSHIDGFAFDVEVFHLVERYGLSLQEVPVQVANSTRSTVKVARDAYRLIRDLFWIRRWSRLGVYDVGADETLPVFD